MTDVQLYLAIGIPGALFALNFLAILATAFWQSKRFEDMGKRFEDRIDSLEKVMNAKFEAVDSRFERFEDRIDSLERVMNARFEAVDAKFDAAQQGLLRVEQVLDARLKHLEERER